MTAPSGLKLQLLDPQEAAASVLEAVARHGLALSQERTPEDQPPSLEQQVQRLRLPEPDSQSGLILLWDGETVVGCASFSLPQKQNTHLLHAEPSVLAQWRRRGLGRTLMRALLQQAEKAGRRSLTFATGSRLPSGAAFLRALNAEVVQEQQFLQLDLKTAPAVWEDWLASGIERTGYRVWSQLGAYPPERLAALAAVYNDLGKAPGDERDQSAWQLTAEDLAQQDRALDELGMVRLSSLAEHSGTGELAALTELRWNKSRPEVVIQHATVVRSQHRRAGLGRWIKAANLQALRQQNPEVRFVRAGNASGQVGMRAINDALGFVPWMTHTDWQLETVRLRRALLRG